jgi:hypothetical protein
MKKIKNKYREPVIGEKIYVPTSLYVYRGEDDFIGGLATINKIKKDENLSSDHCNFIMIGIEGRKGTLYNWKNLLPHGEYETIKLKS